MVVLFDAETGVTGLSCELKLDWMKDMWYMVPVSDPCCNEEFHDTGVVKATLKEVKCGCGASGYNTSIGARCWLAEEGMDEEFFKRWLAYWFGIGERDEVEVSVTWA